MTRLATELRRAAGRGRPAFVPYLVAGDPTIDDSLRCAVAAAAEGADAIEIGLPWSDPMADGPANQAAMMRALEAGVTPIETLQLASVVGRETGRPVIVMTYANPLLRLGWERFVEMSADAGVAGLLVTDLPLEEAEEIRDAAARHAIGMVFLHAPTTPPQRAPRLLEASTGFLYVVARLGVTGGGAAPSAELATRLDGLRHPSVPLGVGFGIRTPQDVAWLRGKADAVIVGSAFSDAIATARARREDPADAVARLTRSLVGPSEAP